MKKERLNEVGVSNEGYRMKIIEYNDANDIWVEFQDDYKGRVHTGYKNFKKGNVKNPFHLSLYGIGYLGQGEYKVSIKRKVTKAYTTWRHMLMRCYDPYYINKKPTYINCYVCEEWHNFQNFAKWFYENYYECNDEMMCLDKDILIKGNRIYSPKTCIFVPKKINSLFIKRDNARGKYLIGVSWHKQKNKFSAGCNILDENNEQKRIHLGDYDNEFQAFYYYKKFKENYIKQVAEEYRNLIPRKLYGAMYRYEVEIND